MHTLGQDRLNGGMKFVINLVHLVQAPPDFSRYYALQDYCFQFEIIKMKIIKFKNKIPHQ